MGRSQAASSQTSKSKTLVCGEWGTWVIVWVHVLSLSSSTSVGFFFLGLIHTVRTMGDSDSTRTRHSALAHAMRPMREMLPAVSCAPARSPAIFRQTPGRGGHLDGLAASLFR